MRTSARVLWSSYMLCSAIALGGCAQGSNNNNNEENCAVSYASITAEAELGLNDTVLGGDELAQSFKVSENKTITKIQLLLQKVGMTSGSFTGYEVILQLVNDSAGKPTGSAVTSETPVLDVSAIGSTSGFYTFTFASNVSLTAGTLYWIRVRGTYPASKKDLIKWYAHNGSSGEYSNGQALYETITSNDWQSLVIGDLRDLLFKIGC